MSNQVGKRAVVIGAGLGGLTAARALTDHFEQVIVLERDELPSVPSQRSGIPQGRHAHALLAGGQRALAELFPAIEEDLLRAGAVAYRAGLDVRVDRPGFDPFPQRDLGWPVYAMSRPLIELTVRRHLEQQGNVEIRQGCRVERLVTDPDRSAVAGVQCVNEDARARVLGWAGRKSETLSAELVVDASGRGELTLSALKSMGIPPPDETTIGVDFGYSSAVFAIPDDAPTSFKSLMVLPRAPESARLALLFPLEQNRWIVSIGGRHGDKPTGEWEGYLAFVRGLRTPTLYQTISRAERLGEVARFGFAESVRRHFERLARFPRGLLPFADAICRFNPIYGQGMSVAAQEACLLRRSLRNESQEPDPLAGLARTFFTELQPLIDAPWALAAMPDLAYPETRGARPPEFETGLRFAAALVRLAAEDPAIHKLMMEVQHLLKPRSVYRDPDLQRRVAMVMAAA